MQKIEPVVDFDALFIPDAPQTISYIIPALATEGVLAHRKTGAQNTEPLLLLGASSWNNALLASRGGRNLDNAVFVDDIDLSEPALQAHPLVEFFKQKIDSQPSTIEVQAFNAASILKQFYSSSDTQLKQGLASVLAQGTPFKGLEKTISFNSQGDSLSALYWFTFKEGKIESFVPELNSLLR